MDSSFLPWPPRAARSALPNMQWLLLCLAANLPVVVFSKGSGTAGGGGGSSDGEQWIYIGVGVLCFCVISLCCGYVYRLSRAER